MKLKIVVHQAVFVGGARYGFGDEVEAAGHMAKQLIRSGKAEEVLEVVKKEEPKEEKAPAADVPKKKAKAKRSFSKK